MKLESTFTANPNLKSDSEFEPLPKGWYQATISQAEVKPTKAGTGSYIKVRYDIIGPSHEGRVVFGNLNIKNPNKKAEEIGRKDLNSLVLAVGLASLSDTDELVGNSCDIKLSVKRSEEYGDGNEVKGFRALSGGAAQASSNPGGVPWSGFGS